MRLEGFGVSGMDTDEVVKSLMMAERMPLRKIEQDKQLVEWKVEEYREVMSEINDFRSEFFDVLNRENYMLSDGVFNSFTTESENSSVVTINATASAMSGSHEVNVTQLATQARATSGSSISKNVTGSNAASFNFSEEGESFTLILDGESRTITLDDSVDSLEKLQESIDERFGEGKVLVQAEENDEIISFAAVEGSGVNRIDVRDAAGGGALKTLGFDDDSNYSNRLGRFDTLGDLADKFAFEGSLFDEDDNISFTINDVDFSFDSDTRLSDMINEINNSDANVTMRYNELSDNFEITSDISGAGKTIEFSEEESSFFEAIDINSEEDIVFGQDAKATIDGQEVTRSNNTFSVSGVSFTLNGESVGDEITTVSVNRDSEAVFDKITNFVSAYNDLIEGINERTSQRRDRDYAPLTQEQRAQMSEDEIETWEERAKEG
ncbi:MAG: flagellar filament capping protein FliD, partial [Candidatus Woesearchaeota archaeon]